MTPTPTIPVPAARRPWTRPIFEDPPPTVRIHPIRSPVSTPPPTARLTPSSFSLDDTMADLSAPVIPHVGEIFLGFKLVEELGRGAFAKVFLAEQIGLSNRLVALKVTRRATHEAERLARLNHTNIVPVYSVHDARPVQAICMPYLGRRTIVDGLKMYHRGNYSSRRGTSARSSRPTVSSVSKWPVSGQSTGEVQLPPLQQVHHAVPAVDPLIGNVGAVLRLLVDLAAGLSHAHGRGILHLDIKPANILIADTGEPMLLDFNLAYDTTGTDRDIVGGTPQYMAPEQLADVKSHGLGKVDPRTDLYSLGVLAHEMLTGDVPFPAPSSRKPGEYDRLAAARKEPLKSLQDRNPDVTPAVDAIIQKLLAPEPDHRYQTADELREDLERQLSHRPLKHAGNLSIRERCAKWKRRNPRLLRRIAAVAAVAFVIGAGVFFQQRAVALSEINAAATADKTHAALDPLRLDLILGEERTRLRGKAQAEELLKEYGLPDDADWRKRSAFARLPEARRPVVAAELGEVLLLLAEARWQDARKDRNADPKTAAADSLRLNKIARDCFPPDAAPPFLLTQRKELEAIAGTNDNATDEPRTVTAPRDHFLEAARLITASRYEAAVEPLQAVVKAEPNHAAAQFLLGACRHQLGQHTRALERYEMAQSLLPADPRPAFYRGVVFGLERRPDKAEFEFNQAITLDPKYGEAYRYRASARLRLGSLDRAEEDLTTALDLKVPALQVYSLRAEVREARKDTAGAEADRKAAAMHEPRSERDFLVRGCSLMKKDPKAALSDFQMVLKLNPRCLPALLNESHLYTDQLKDLPAALAVADRLVEAVPEYAPGHANRAIVLARLGKRAEAHAAAARARECSDHMSITFQMACAYAITSEQAGDQAGVDRKMALSLLRQAFRDGFRDAGSLELNHDLDALRKLPEFTSFVSAMKELSR